MPIPIHYNVVQQMVEEGVRYILMSMLRGGLNFHIVLMKIVIGNQEFAFAPTDYILYMDSNTYNIIEALAKEAGDHTPPYITMKDSDEFYVYLYSPERMSFKRAGGDKIHILY